MGELFAKINELAANDQYIVSAHAAERLEERGILEWQVVDGLASGVLLCEDLDAEPNPAVEVEELLPDGTPIKAVWSHIVFADIAKLVTVHFFDE
jgi:hypothetical protein